MFRTLIITLCAFLFTAFPVQSDPLEPVSLPDKKTIVVLCSHGGGGHIAAANTLETLIGDQYSLKVIYPIDQLKILGIPNAEHFFYNVLLKKGWTRSVNFLSRHVVPNVFRSLQSKLEKLIKTSIDVYKPDLVISLIPFVNYPASEAARKKDVPYLLITTDNDLSNWVHGLDKLKHPHFRVTIGSDLPTTRDLLKKKHIPDHRIETIGLPLRPEFISHKDETRLREEFHIPSQKPVILIMMGGAGGNAAYDYARKVGSLDLKTHLIVVCGRNEKLKKDLQKLSIHEGNTMTVLGFTDRVADLMTMADLIITKPGPGTINEAISKHIPVLIDNTDISLFWERANTDMVIRHGIGTKVKNLRQMKELLTSFLNEEPIRSGYEKSFEVLPANQFHERILSIVNEMVASKEAPVELSMQQAVSEIH